MARSTSKNGSTATVIDRALKIGWEQASGSDGDNDVELKLTVELEQMVLALCTVFGLSVRATLNACLRYGLHWATAQGVSIQSLREYPKRLNGEVTRFAVTAETLGKVREAHMLEQMPACTVAGIKLLHGRTLNFKSRK
jgi:hypothetical protein